MINSPAVVHMVNKDYAALKLAMEITDFVRSRTPDYEVAGLALKAACDTFSWKKDWAHLFLYEKSTGEPIARAMETAAECSLPTAADLSGR
jgi:hypothetical protein